MDLIKRRWLMLTEGGGGGYNDGVCVEDTARVRSKVIDDGIVKQIKCWRQRNGPANGGRASERLRAHLSPYSSHTLFLHFDTFFTVSRLACRNLDLHRRLHRRNVL